MKKAVVAATAPRNNKDVSKAIVRHQKNLFPPDSEWPPAPPTWDEATKQVDADLKYAALVVAGMTVARQRGNSTIQQFKTWAEEE